MTKITAKSSGKKLKILGLAVILLYVGAKLIQYKVHRNDEKKVIKEFIIYYQNNNTPIRSCRNATEQDVRDSVARGIQNNINAANLFFDKSTCFYQGRLCEGPVLVQSIFTPKIQTILSSLNLNYFGTDLNDCSLWNEVIAEFGPDKITGEIDGLLQDVKKYKEETHVINEFLRYYSEKGNPIKSCKVATEEDVRKSIKEGIPNKVDTTNLYLEKRECLYKDKECGQVFMVSNLMTPELGSLIRSLRLSANDLYEEKNCIFWDDAIDNFNKQK